MQIISTPGPSLSCPFEGVDGRTQWESSSRACKPPLIKLPSRGCLEAHGHALHSSEVPQGLASPGGTRLLLSGVLPFAERRAQEPVLGSLHRCPLCHPPARTTCIGHTAEGTPLTQLQNDGLFWEALQIYSHLFPQRTCRPCARHLAAPQADGREGTSCALTWAAPPGGRGGSRWNRGLVSVPDCELVRGQKREGWRWWEECRLLLTGHGLYWNS